MLRAGDVMQASFPVSRHDEPVREAGRAMAKADLELVPIVDDNGALIGVLTERALARRYVRDSLRTSTLEEAPTYLSALVSVLEGDLVTGDERQLSGRVWVYAMDPASESGISDGDIVVIGNRPEAQVRVIERGAALVVISNSATPSPDAVAAARERGTAIIVSPLDSYVAGRMITLAAPCSALMERDPLTVNTDFLISDMSEQIKESHYGAAVAVDADNRPVGLVTRSDLVAPPAGGWCSLITPSRRRAPSASTMPRSWRSSITTTSARSKPGSRSPRRSIRSARRRRWWWSGSARRAWSPAGRRR